MDENPKVFARKQRQKNQRYGRKPPQKQGEPASTSPVVDNGSDPLPQRANRRQRCEAEAPPDNSARDPASTPSKDNNETTEKENVTIDFSNLKRETEEIAKLTKKFAKRNISSNWHRYSAPEGNEEGDEKTEEEVPADFSALIRVPASKGGHLQLKEEQEWSSASGEQLGGYFALNLKLLSQSLACVPIYEQLRLPKHMFTEEELKHFDSLASQAANVYNPDNIEDPNTKVAKSLTNLLQRESDVVEEPETENDRPTDNTFNILDLQGSNQKLLNIESEPQITPDNLKLDNCNVRNSNRESSEKDSLSFNTISNENKNPVQLRNEECLVNDKLFKETSHNNLSISNSLKENESLKTENVGFIEEKSSNFLKTKSKKQEEQNDSLTQTSTKHKITEGVDKVVENSLILSKNFDIAKETSTGEIKQTNNCNPDSIIMSEPKDKRASKNSKKSINDANENKSNNRENNIELEDDDDLDFLLSLKKPILPEKNKESKSVANKDTTSLPGSGTPPQTSSTEPHSELDDWLDSVLQD